MLRAVRSRIAAALIMRHALKKKACTAIACARKTHKVDEKKTRSARRNRLVAKKYFRHSSKARERPKGLLLYCQEDVRCDDDTLVEVTH